MPSEITLNSRYYTSDGISYAVVIMGKLGFEVYAVIEIKGNDISILHTFFEIGFAKQKLHNILYGDNSVKAPSVPIDLDGDEEVL